MRTTRLAALALLALCALFPPPARAAADRLHVPYFEVDLSAPDGRTALAAVTDAGGAGGLVRFDVFSLAGDWVAGWNVSLQPWATHTLNWRDVLLGGRDLCFAAPDNTTAEEFQAALEVGPGLYAGYAWATAVTACVGHVVPGDPGYEALRDPAPRLAGDEFRVEPGEDFADGSRLPATLCPGRHLVRFLLGGPFDGTTLYLYAPAFAGSDPDQVAVTGRDEAGEPTQLQVNFVGGLGLFVEASNAIDVAEGIGPAADFGVLEVDCGGAPCRVAARYEAEGRYSAGAVADALDCP